MKTDRLQYDVVVAGVGSGGVVAAIAAARQGAYVLLIEQNGYLGGGLVSGLPLLGYLDRSGRQIIGGLAQEMLDRLSALDENGFLGHCRCGLHHSVSVVNPDLLKIVLFQMCREAGVKLLLHTFLTDACVDNGALKTVDAVGKSHRFEIGGHAFIDATGDGDMAYLAGARYNRGQKDTGVLQPPTLLFTLADVDLDTLFAYLDDHPEELRQAGSIEHDGTYNAAHFRANKSHVLFGLCALFARLKMEGVPGVTRDTFIYISTPKKGQVVINGMRVLNFDGSDVYDLTRGEAETHEQILNLIRIAREHIPGFERCSLSSIEPTIGVRESRRIVGADTLTVDRALRYEVPGDTVALGSYPIDIHSGVDETSIIKTVERPYGIPYGCLVSADIQGLMMAGNASSEIRMHVTGANCHMGKVNFAETGILEEILLENKSRNPAQAFPIWDKILWEKAHFQENLDLYLNTK